MPAVSNIYSHSRMSAISQYASHVSGNESGLFAVVCTSRLSPQARNAMEKSAESMGYGKEGVVFISVDAGNNALSPKEMFELLEAVDPLSVVLTGAECIQLFAQAYRVNVPNQPAFRVFGREIRSIANMNELMETPEGKQIAWAALKTLPHIGS